MQKAIDIARDAVRRSHQVDTYLARSAERAARDCRNPEDAAWLFGWAFRLRERLYDGPYQETQP